MPPITPNWRGSFNLATTYSVGDLVSFFIVGSNPQQNTLSTWISNINSNVGNIPGIGGAWGLFASGGQNGINAWRGVWASSTEYNAFDGVSYLGSSYVSLASINQNNVPSTSPSQWAVLALGGAAGPAGSFVFRGVWSSIVQYHPNDIVAYLGSSYACYNTPPVGGLPTNTTYWQLIASVGSQGVAGPVGPAGEGLGFVFRGPWSTLTAYHVNDVVSLLGSSYVAVSANTGVNPSTDGGTNWQILAQAGAPGSSLPLLQIDGINNTDQAKLNIIPSGILTATADAHGGVTLNVTMGGALTLTAGQNINAFQGIAVRGDGLAYIADAGTVADAGRFVGISVTSATTGNPVQFQQNGIINNNGFLFTPGETVYLGLSGALVQTPGTGLFELPVGVAISASELAVEIGLPIIYA